MRNRLPIVYHRDLRSVKGGEEILRFGDVLSPLPLLDVEGNLYVAVLIQEDITAILQRALARPDLRGRGDGLQCLADSYEEWGKPEQQAAAIAQLKQGQKQSRVMFRPSPSTFPAPTLLTAEASPPIKKPGRVESRKVIPVTL